MKTLQRLDCMDFRIVHRFSDDVLICLMWMFTEFTVLSRISPTTLALHKRSPHSVPRPGDPRCFHDRTASRANQTLGLGSPPGT